MKESFAALSNSLTKKTPYKGPGADSEEKHEPVSDIDIAVVDSLKALDPKPPIREANIAQALRFMELAGPFAERPIDGRTPNSKCLCDGRRADALLLERPHL